MKIWQQALTQKMTFNQSYSKDSDSSEAPAFLRCFKLPVPPAVRRPQTITRAAVRVLQAG